MDGSYENRTNEIPTRELKQIDTEHIGHVDRSPRPSSPRWGHIQNSWRIPSPTGLPLSRVRVAFLARVLDTWIGTYSALAGSIFSRTHSSGLLKEPLGRCVP